MKMGKCKTPGRVAPSKAKKESTYRASSTKGTTNSVRAKKLPARASRSTVSYKDESEEESEEESEADDDYGSDDAIESVEVERKPVFTVFESEAPLEEGLCVVRSLGGGKYELVNLDAIPRNHLASEETGVTIKNTPERREMFAITKERWQEVSVKIELAAKSADGQIFRLMKLPLELRYRIYDFAVISERLLRVTNATDTSNIIGLALLRTSRQLRRECTPFFWKNNFKINEVVKNFIPHRDQIAKNVREITFEWWGFAKKDVATLTFFAQCKQLKTLNIKITQWAVDNKQYHHRQFKFQDETSIKRFNKTNGFDVLVAIRGLQKVTVQNAASQFAAKDLTQAELDAFAAFLTRELCQPKPVEAETKASKKRRSIFSSFRRV